MISSSEPRRRGLSRGLLRMDSDRFGGGLSEAERCVGCRRGSSFLWSKAALPRFNGCGFGPPPRTDCARLIGSLLLPLEPLPSPSGGGVGGNMLRFIGGSDCCRALL